jgi:MerR family transcriptional regulator, light-induced transcriptional regulator
VTEAPTMFAPGDVARLLGVSPKTVTRWCVEGRLTAFRTPGGHRRIPADALVAFLREMGVEEKAATAMLSNAGS